MNFILKYYKNTDFLGFCLFVCFVFESQKRCLPQFSVFSVLYSLSLIFLCFLYRGKFATLNFNAVSCFNLWILNLYCKRLIYLIITLPIWKTLISVTGCMVLKWNNPIRGLKNISMHPLVGSLMQKNLHNSALLIFNKIPKYGLNKVLNEYEKCMSECM